MYFYFKINRFVKLAHLVGFTREIYQEVDPINVNGKDSQNILAGIGLGMLKERRMGIASYNSV